MILYLLTQFTLHHCLIHILIYAVAYTIQEILLLFHVCSFTYKQYVSFNVN